MLPRIAIILLLAFALIGITNRLSSVKAQQTADHLPGQILVKFKSNTSRSQIDNQLKSQKATVIDKIQALDVLVIKVPPQTENTVLNALSKNPTVEYAEFNFTAQALMTVNDPYFSRQWSLDNPLTNADINAPQAWDQTLGAGIKVAILDTGISKSHPDLSSKITFRANFSDSSTDDDVYGHGTHVGGIVAANTNNGLGIAGVCPNCQLLSIKVLNDKGSGAYSWITNGITAAVANGAKVINMSLGGSSKSNTLENAVNYAWKNGVVVVAAAGNSGNPSKTYPAAYTNAIAVAATDSNDQKAGFSEYGNWVDVAAPGVNIFSTWNDNTSDYNPQPICPATGECYKSASGTSMATPMTSGTVALIWSTPYASSAASVRNRLESTADKISGTGTFWVSGRINAAKAVSP